MTYLNRIFIAAAALALVAAALGLNSHRAVSADVMITQFTTQNISQLLTEMGATEVKAVKGESGTESVVFKYEGGATVFSIINCKAAPCRDLQMSVFFEKDAKFNHAFANTFNARWLDATAVVMSDGTLMLTGLLIANGGITKEHMRDVFAMFLNAPNLMADQIKTLQTVSYGPAAAPYGPPAVTGALQRQSYVPEHAKYARRSLRQYFNR